MIDTNKLGSVHFETGRGYRASLTINGMRIRSQRLKTRKEATKVLGLIRDLVTRVGNIKYGKLNRLEHDSVISVTVV